MTLPGFDLLTLATIGKVYLLAGCATAFIFSLRGPHQWPAFLACLLTPLLVWFFAVRHYRRQR